MITPTKLAKVQDVSVLSNFLPYIHREVDSLIHAVENRVFRELREGTLTPEAAMSAWMEVNALRQLSGRFDTRVRVGVSVGEEVATELQMDRRT